MTRGQRIAGHQDHTKKPIRIGRTACAGNVIPAALAVFKCCSARGGFIRTPNFRCGDAFDDVACRSHSRKFAAFYRFNDAGAGAREEKTS
jgi:hypothetical protein